MNREQRINLVRYDEASSRRSYHRLFVFRRSRRGGAVYYEIRQYRCGRGDKQREAVEWIRGLSARSNSLHPRCGGTQE